MKSIVCCVALLGATWTASAGTIFYSIGANDFGQPVRVVAIDPAASTATPLFDLQSATATFSGLTYDSVNGQFYAVMDDGSGSSTMVTFSPAGGGAYSTVMSLNPGTINPLDFNGGLVYDSFDSYFYSMANSADGSSFLYRIDVAGNALTLLTEALPLSFNGGLTVNDQTSLLGMLNGSDATASVYQFALGQSSAFASGLYSGIGMAFYGGLAWGGVPCMPSTPMIPAPAISTCLTAAETQLLCSASAMGSTTRV